ncbi:MAG: hypothetical protein AUH29_09200 [Candidatus Rokubacteria bacterium 13_1_40CM_69_27]|nr:MAG: hypothetical protein AUH29_09200 [Candidatus Rokubacteria bacterium 13_1_40CM_69_27]
MMSAPARWEYLKAIYARYRQARREGKSEILDEFCRTTGYHRKYALRLLNGPPPGGARPRRRRRPVTYNPAVIQALTTIWEAAGYPWSVRLKALLPAWLPWARRRLNLSPVVCRQLRTISARQIDRRLAPAKRQRRPRRYGRTKPGTLLKHHIPLKTDHWAVTTPGFVELDLVAHAGARADGEFAHSLNVTDIHTTWVETRAVLGRGELRVQEALEEIRQVLPFRLRGIDSDNGSEFINDHLYRYCQAQEIQFTRGRPYKKDDNAHIEQKNWTHVRKLVGYLRYDTPAAVAALNDLYRHELRVFQNLFLPSVKLRQKERVGARQRRRYDTPRTPLERVLACPAADPAAVAQLVALRDRLDPFVLAQAIDRKLERLVALTRPRGSGPAPPASPPPPQPVKRRPGRPDFTFANHLRRPMPRLSRVTS